MEKSKIEAVKLVRQIRDAQHEQLKSMTWAERVAFYQTQAEQLHKEIEQRSKSKKQPNRRPNPRIKRTEGGSENPPV